MRLSLLSPALVASLVGYGSTIALVLSAAAAVGASPAQTASWVFAICLAKAAGSALLSWRARVPVVLQTDIYAVAALAGGAIVALGHMFGIPAVLTLLPGAAFCFFLRLMAIYCGWHLPRARKTPPPPEG